MARKTSPSSKALAKLPDAVGGSIALRDELFTRAGITNERLAHITRIIIEETLAAAQGAMRQQPVVVADGRGLSHVEVVTMPDEALRQRCREALVNLIGLAPSKAQTVQVANNLVVNITKREPPLEYYAAKVVNVGDVKGQA
jgi:hypothetical protein